MKASLKFREEQKPLLRAKVPISALGLPFQSGIVAGDSKELCLTLGTFFESGPSIKLSYRPNDSLNPFSLAMKSGTGKLGSPMGSPLLINVDFNLLGTGSPSFMLHLKPQLGDFSFKKSQSSVGLEKIPGVVGAGAGFNSNDDGAIKMVDVLGIKSLRNIRVGRGSDIDGDLYENKITILPPQAASAIAGMLSGVEVAARTSFPLKSTASLNFRWGLKFPSLPAGDSDTSPGAGGIDLRKLPFLVMNKIGVEFLTPNELERQPSTTTPPLVAADAMDACLSLKRQVEILQSDNGRMRTALEELRRDMQCDKNSNVSPTPTSGFQTDTTDQKETRSIRRRS